MAAGVEVRRQRFVEVSREALMAPSDQTRRIRVEAFPDASFEVNETGAWWTKDQSTFLWTGKIAGMQRGSVVVAITGEIVSANISTDNGEFYWVRQVDGTLHCVQQVDPDAVAQHPEDTVLPAAAVVDSAMRNATPERLATGERDSAATIDVLVAYTAAAKTAAGGTASMVNKINLAIAEMNQSFVNSSVAITVQLAAAVEVAYTEAASISQDLDNLRGTTDGQLDEVHALRNQHGADLVSLLIQRSASGTVGQAFLMQSPGSYFASFAFSVTEQAYATGPNYTFAHELGHNLGCAHDRANTGSGGAYSYSYGYQGSNFRSIMAYACSGRSCPRINYWSNPAVSYAGAPTGVSSDLANSADNAQSLNNTASAAAAFRSSASGCVFSLSPPNASTGASGASGTFAVTGGAGCGWTAASGSSWISVTSGASGSGSGTVAYTVQANTGAARTGTITAAGLTFTINQSAGACMYSLSSSGVTIPAASHAGSVAVSAGTGCAWTASAADNWIQVTAGQSGSGNGTVGYSVSANAGSARSGSVVIAGQSFSVSQEAVAGVSVLITSVPSGLALQVDGAAIMTPRTLVWTPGSSHTLAAATQGTGTRYAFTNWSNGGAASQTVAAPASSTAYSASFQPQYLLTSNSSPAEGGSVTVSPASADGYYNAGTIVSATATPAPGFTFSQWSGLSTAILNPVSISMDSQKTISASFVSSATVTIQSNPSGRTVSVDGISYTAPAVFHWTSGSVHMIGAPSPQQAAGVEYAFTGWSDGGSPVHSVTASAANTSYTANFTGQALCVFSLSQTDATVLPTGDLRQLGIATTPGCSWNAASNASWITVLSGASGTGSGSLRFRVEANANGTARTGTLTIAGLIFPVTQSAASCTYTLTGPLTALSPAQLSFAVAVSTQPGCRWSASAYPFLSAVPASGTGSATVNVTVSANANQEPRLGVVTVGGQHLQLIQRGSLGGSLFGDVPTSYLFVDYINLLKFNNVTPGCGATGYCPEDPMLRTEMAAFVIRALFGETFSYTQAPYFTDVSVAHPYFKYIQKMRDLGITVGCTETSYCPDGQVSRGQMAAFLVRARLNVTQGTPFPHAPAAYFTDVASTHLFFPFVQKMKELGITSGCTATAYCPDQPVTRGQMSVFVNRAFLY
ncbi:MAG: S-layer homology domain-containing protein [Bryobacterales bacterium]|nr:S-layer homology domain-containing protein [Bryobacterales bacterium]